MNRVFFSLLSALFLVLGSCNLAQSQYVLNPQDFSGKFEKTPGATVLDVRTPSEYTGGHLQGALNIDWNGSSFNKQAGLLDKSKPVFVYCHSGRRSDAAAKYLRAAGFQQVYELAGGIEAWVSEKMPVSN